MFKLHKIVKIENIGYIEKIYLLIKQFLGIDVL